MVRVDVFNAHPTRRVAGKVLARYVRRVLRLKGVTVASVSVVLVGSSYIKRINRQYLNHDAATDVISFPLETKPGLEGEVYVNLDRARTQAGMYGVKFSHEVARLVIHGALHLVGFDDTTARQAARMKRAEDRHLRFWFG
jgi:rRNA maturation RNase YbeY